MTEYPTSAHVVYQTEGANNWFCADGLWLSIAQAYFPNSDVLEVLKQETFMQAPAAGVTPIEGLWRKPT